MNETFLNISNINASINVSYSFSNNCLDVLKDYANGYNMGQAAAMTQLFNLTLLLLISISFYMFSPILFRFIKTEKMREYLKIIQSCALFAAFTSAVLIFALNYFNVAVKVGGVVV